MNINKYLYTILTNDSFLIVNSLIPFKNIFHPDIELIGICDSYQTKYHIPDFLRCYNNKGIKKIYNYYIKNAYKITDYYSIIIQYEINSINIFDNKSVLFKMDKNYTNNLHFDDEVLKDYLYNKKYPIIKIKKLKSTTYSDKKNLPDDFDCDEYKNIHPDLMNIHNPKQHFLENGIYEGRIYKKNQELICHDYLIPFIFS